MYREDRLSGCAFIRKTVYRVYREDRLSGFAFIIYPILSWVFPIYRAFNLSYRGCILSIVRLSYPIVRVSYPIG